MKRILSVCILAAMLLSMFFAKLVLVDEQPIAVSDTAEITDVVIIFFILFFINPPKLLLVSIKI